MNKLMTLIETAQNLFKAKLEAVLQSAEGLTEEQYVRYLSMQYHLTKGVQRHFFQMAGHADFARRRSFRKFLVEFANEEELHYEIALNDLKGMDRTPLDCPVDVTLWWAYFDSIIGTRPFIRLGATTILENIAATSGEIIKKLFAKANYLNERNTRFFTIHQHDETLPHGTQILEALKAGRLEPAHWNDLIQGAQIAMHLYLRMAEWSLAVPTTEEVSEVTTETESTDTLAALQLAQGRR